MRLMTGLLAVVSALGFQSSVALAQAWSDDRGTLSVGAQYAFQMSDATFHDGFAVGGVPSDSHQFNLKADYVPIENLTVAAQLMSAATRYTGPQTGASPDIIVAHGSQDDGSYHYALTDLELEVRYSVLTDRFGVTPAVRGLIPVTDYEVRGYAAHGNGLLEGGAGVYFGIAEAPIERSFLGASYFFTLVQKLDVDAETEAISMHRSDFGLNWGYQITDKIVASLGAAGRITHGGMNLDDIRMHPMSVQMWHDPLLNRRYLSVNLIGGYAITDSLSAMLGLGLIPIGLNVSNAKTASLTFTWTMAP